MATNAIIEAMRANRADAAELQHRRQAMRGHQRRHARGQRRGQLDHVPAGQHSRCHHLRHHRGVPQCLRDHCGVGRFACGRRPGQVCATIVTEARI